MGLMDKFLNAFGYEKARAYVTPTGLSSYGSNDIGRATPQNYGSYLKQYGDAPWVYSCIRTIAAQGSGVPLKLYRKKIINDKAIYTEVTSHPISTLLAKVNPFLTGSDLIEATLSYEELTGNAYWLLDMFEGGKPTEIYPLRPDRIKIVPDKKEFIKSYKYEIGSNEYVTFKAEQIIHFKYFNSTDDFYGLSPISASRMAIETQKLGDEYNKNFYENSAEPKGALVSENPLKADAKKRIAAAWRALHQGTKNAHKVAILEGGLDWKALGISQKDMDFINGKKMTREDILGVFGVPPAMVGVFEFANYANSKEQREIFWRNTEVPKLNKLAETINEFLVKPWDESLEVRPDYSSVDALQADMQVRATTDEILTRSGIKTINEARVERGLPTVAWGDVWYAPLNSAPVGTQPKPPESSSTTPKR
jgi:HK97 family phage portal protein